MRLVFVLVLCAAVAYAQRKPVIGILSQANIRNYNGRGTGVSYIAASYVKYLESAGARVVPILINQRPEYYDKLFANLNGVLFPGGQSTSLTSGYANAGRILHEKAVKANLERDYFPIWGTCLGFQLLASLAAQKVKPRIVQPDNLLITCDNLNTKTSLTLAHRFDELRSKTKMFSNLNLRLFDVLRDDDVTYNYHRRCLTRGNLKKSGLDKLFKVISTNNDKRGMEYISTMERLDLPFFGTQFHPEKNEFETGAQIPQGPKATLAAQYFGNFFVNEARKSPHKFTISKQEQERLNIKLISNYRPEQGRPPCPFQQIYFFPRGPIRN